MKQVHSALVEIIRAIRRKKQAFDPADAGGLEDTENFPSGTVLNKKGK